MSAVALQEPGSPFVSSMLGALSRAGSGAGPLSTLRRSAAEAFAALGLPTPREEAWKFTNLKVLAELAAEVAGSDAAAVDPMAVDPWRVAGSHELVFVNGHYRPELSRTGALPAGVVAGSLAELIALRPILVEPTLGRHAQFERHAPAALNTALFADGAAVILPRNTVVDLPVHLLFLSAAGDQPRAAFPRVLLQAGENSQVTVVETHAGLGGAVATFPVTEVVVGDGAVVDHYTLQRESPNTFHIATQAVHQGRASRFSTHWISVGGRLVRKDLRAHLAGEGGEAILNSLYLAGGTQHVDAHLVVEHAQPHCDSHELFKGILDGRASAVFDGLIHVHPGAQKTNAKQTNRNLLLSRGAVANSNPQLRIFADDVKCTHGSTTGHLDDEAVFYLRSRGIGEAAARGILTYAFAADLLAGIKVDQVREDLEALLFDRLPEGDVVRQAV